MRKGALAPKSASMFHLSSEQRRTKVKLNVSESEESVSEERARPSEIIFFSSQQARRGTDYKLYVDNWHVYETQRVLKQLWKLYPGMLL